MKATLTLTVTVAAVVLMSGTAAAQHIVPSALLTIDQNRSTVVERIVGEWGDRLTASNAGINSAQLREILSGLRSDHLLAASLAGNMEGLRNVVAGALVHTEAAVSSGRMHAMALGDAGDDLVYTPVSPCRLFDTRPSQGGVGVMTPNVRRTYGATTPVANQGGPGSCAASAGAAVALIQIGSLTPSGNGYLQGGAQGVASFPNALILYQPGDQYGTAVAMPLNVANGQFDVQVQFAATDLYGDLLGYFQRPKNYSGTHIITGIDATDSGGFNNTASGYYSTVGGGDSNTASGFHSTVAGGSDNTASGQFSAVAGGQSNNASGSRSAISGGDSNTASGQQSTVPGGEDNTASGDFSFAAGSRAKALGSGSFVWSDSKPFDFINAVTFPNVFAVRATGGATFTTDIDGSGNPIRGVAILPGGIVDFGSNTRQMINLYGGAAPAFGIGVQLGATYFRSNNAFCWHKNGVHSDTECDPGSGGTRLMRLDGGGNLYATTFTPTSDRNAKRDFAAVDSLEILDKVVALPISTWAYKIDPGTRHIGPMAQDFTASFGMGVDDKHIATVDADGVALAAIQGLHQLLKQKDRKIAAMEGELAAIKAKLNMR